MGEKRKWRMHGCLAMSFGEIVVLAKECKEANLWVGNRTWKVLSAAEVIDPLAAVERAETCALSELIFRKSSKLGSIFADCKEFVVRADS